MNKHIKIFIVPLIVSGMLYFTVLKKKDSAIANFLDSIPAFKEKKEELYKDFGVEVLKIVVAYFATYMIIK